MSETEITAAEMGRRSARAERARVGEAGYTRRLHEMGKASGIARRQRVFELQVNIALLGICGRMLADRASEEHMAGAMMDSKLVAQEAGLPVPATPEQEVRMRAAIMLALGKIGDQFAAAMARMNGETP